jgi:hypothetical protein
MLNMMWAITIVAKPVANQSVRKRESSAAPITTSGVLVGVGHQHGHRHVVVPARPEQREELAATKAEVQLAHGREVTESLRDALKLEARPGLCGLLGAGACGGQNSSLLTTAPTKEANGLALLVLRYGYIVSRSG